MPDLEQPDIFVSVDPFERFAEALTIHGGFVKKIKALRRNRLKMMQDITSTKCSKPSQGKAKTTKTGGRKKQPSIAQLQKALSKITPEQLLALQNKIKEQSKK